MIAPDSEAGVVAALSDAHAAKTPLRIEGNGSKSAMLRSVQAAESLSTRNLTGITLYSPNELIVSVRPGTPVAELEAELARHGQHLVAEPPAQVDGVSATIGGTVAANVSGPRRVTGGASRDHVMGIRMVNGAGELLRFGGRVLKNVTGLDMCKLLSGSHGTLGVLTEITLKVLPAPEDTGSLVFDGLPAAEAVKTLSAALGSPYGVSGAAWLPGGMAAIRIEDFSDSVAYRLTRLRDQLGGRILPADESRELWRRVRDLDPLGAAAGDALWRLHLRPSRAPSVLAALPAATALLDWGGGVAYVAGPASLHDDVCAAAGAAGGTWTVLRAPEPLRAVAAVVPPESAALAALTRRVKSALDPHGILNPGRIYAGI